MRRRRNQRAGVVSRLRDVAALIVIAVGALFDYLAGNVKRGPRWLTDWGGEWLSRLYSEPRRLWRRYLLGNPIFVWLVWCQWTRKHVAALRDSDL